MGLLETAGLSFVAEGAGGFIDAVGKAKQSVGGFAAEAQKSEGGLGALVGGLGKVAAIAAGAVVAGVAAATTAVIGGITAFGDWAKKLDDISDVLGTTADESAALTIAIGRVGGNTELITQQMAKLSTGLVTVDGKLGPAGKTLNEMGIAFKNTSGEILPATDLLQNIADKLADMPDGLEKTTAMTRLFGKSGKELSDTMNGLAHGGLAAAGEEAKKFGLAIGDKGVQSSIEMKKGLADLGFAAQGLAVSLGGALMPVILPLVQQFSQWAISVMPSVREGIMTVGAALSPLISTVSVFVQGFIAATDKMGFFTAVLDRLIPGAGGVIDVIQKIITAISNLATGVQQPSTEMSKLSDIFTTAGAVIGAVVNAIGAVVTAVFGQVAIFLQAHGDEIQGFIKTAWNAILDIIKLALQLINATVVPALQAIAGFITAHGAQIQAIFTSVWNIISTLITTILAIIKGVIQATLQLINGDTQGALNTLRGVFDTVWNAVKVIVTNAINAVKAVVNVVLTALGTDVDTLWNTIKTTIQTAVDNIKKAVTDGFEYVKMTVVRSIQNAINGIGALLGEFYNKGKEIIENIVNGIIALGGHIRDTVMGFVNDAIKGAISAINSAIDGIKNTISGIWNTITNIRNALGGLGGNGSGIRIAGSNLIASPASLSQMSSNVSYSNSYQRSYNLSVNSQQQVSDIRQSFALMEALAA